MNLVIIYLQRSLIEVAHPVPHPVLLMKAKLYALVLFLLLMNSNIWALDEVIEASDEEVMEPVSIEASCLAWEQLGYGALYYKFGEQFLPIKVPVFRRSETIQLNAEQTFELYVIDSEGGTMATDGSIYRLVGNIQTGAETGPLLFLFEKGSAADTVSIRIHQEVSDDVAGTAFNVVNFTDSQLSILINDESVSLPAYGSELVQLAAESAGQFVPFTVKDDTSKVLYQTRLYCQASSIENVFIYSPKEEGKQPIIRFLSDLR